MDSDAIMLALIATHPHPNAAGLMLILVYNGFSALERALRLFPFRTGIAGPDWIVIADGADNFGAGGVVAAGCVLLYLLTKY